MKLQKKKWPCREFQGGLNKTPSVDGMDYKDFSNKRSKKFRLLELVFLHF